MARRVTVMFRKFSIDSAWKTNPRTHFYWSIHRTRRARYFSWNPMPTCSLFLGVYPRSLLLKWNEDWLPKKEPVCCQKEWEKMRGSPRTLCTTVSQILSHRISTCSSSLPQIQSGIVRSHKRPTAYTLTIAGEMALRPSCPSSGFSVLVTRWRSSVTVPHPTIILWLTLLGHFWLSWWLGSAIKL